MNLRKIVFAPLDKVALALGYVPVTQAVSLMKQQNAALGHAGHLLSEVKQIIESVDTLKGVNIDGYELEALRNLVADHEELEARIEAVLLRLANGEVDIAEISSLLCGGKRIPDTVEGLAGD